MQFYCLRAFATGTVFLTFNCGHWNFTWPYATVRHLICNDVTYIFMLDLSFYIKWWPVTMLEYWNTKVETNIYHISVPSVGTKAAMLQPANMYSVKLNCFISRPVETVVVLCIPFVMQDRLTSFLNSSLFEKSFVLDKKTKIWYWEQFIISQLNKPYWSQLVMSFPFFTIPSFIHF